MRRVTEQSKVQYPLLLGVVLLLGFGIRFYRLDFNEMGNDTAWICKRGILFFEGHWWQLLLYRGGPVTPLLIGISNIAFGVGETSSRIPSVVAGVVLCAITYGFGKELFNERVGLIAAAIVAVSTPFVLMSRVAGPIMIAEVFILLAIYSFYRYITEQKVFWGVVFSFALTLGVMTRITAFLTIPVCLAIWWMHSGKLSFFANKEFLSITIPFWIMAYPYLLLMLAQSFLIDVGGVVSDTLSGGLFWFGIPFYERVMYEYFSPVMFFLIVATFIFIAYRVGKRIEVGKPELLCLVWFLIIFLFYALLVEKAKPFYLLASFCPLAILCGFFIASVMEGGKKKVKVLALIALVCVLSGNAIYTHNTIFTDEKEGFRVPYDTYGTYTQHGLKALGWWMHQHSSPDDVIISAGFLDSSVEFYTNRMFIAPSQRHSKLSVLLSDVLNTPEVNRSHVRYAIATVTIDQPEEKAYIEEVKKKHPLVAVIRVRGDDKIYIYDLKESNLNISPAIINSEEVEGGYKNTGEFYPTFW